MARTVPWLHTLTLTSANTNYNLQTLMRAADAGLPTAVALRCQSLQIQFDIAAGGDVLYIGNSTLSPTDCGVILYATQAWSVPSVESNLIMPGDINLRSNGAGHVVYISMVVR